MNSYTFSSLTEDQISALCKRPKMDFPAVFREVEPIIDHVEREGDAAVNRFNRKFDGVSPDPLVIHPGEHPHTPAAPIKQAIDTAFNNIYRFHKSQLPMPIEVETMPGVRCRRVARPIERVGLYIPGGSAILPSTLMMLGIPAALAGCRQIVIATPPRKEGSVDESILYIARKIGATHLLQAGGAQGVAAMSFGTRSVPKVDKILGPGNQYVTAAKMLLQNSEAQVSIDMPAGPSEVLVIADGSARPEFVAADLLSQAEHGPDSQVVLVGTGEFDFKGCRDAMDRQLNVLPRKEVAAQAASKSLCIEVNDLQEAFEFSNRYAPEHLVVQCDGAEEWQAHIQNAGSVFFGHWTPESVGDYASGTNHTLPTYGYARMYSGVSVDSFIKHITMQNLSGPGLAELGPTVEILAELEGLQAHKNAVSIRLNAWNNREPNHE